MINRVRGFAVNGDIHGQVAVKMMACLGIQFDNPDEPEVGSVGDPQPATGWIQQESGINGVAVLDAVGRSDDMVVIPGVVGGIRVERLAPLHTNGAGVASPQTAAGRGVGHIVTIANVDQVGGRPGLNPGSAVPRPAVVGNQAAAAGAPTSNICHRTPKRSKDRGCRVRRPKPMPDQPTRGKAGRERLLPEYAIS